MRAILTILAIILFVEARSYRKPLAMPLGNVPVSVCKHRFDAKATYTDCTDGLLAPTAHSAELYAFRHNIAITAFINNANLPWPATDLRSMDSTGRWSFGIYFPTDRWEHPITHAIGIIPDYNNDEWTAAGVAVFSNAVLGATKPDRYPNHGQQMYEASNGTYGYNLDYGTPGVSNMTELKNVALSMITYYRTVFGRYPSALSYRNGQLGSAPFLAPYFLGGRNSDASYSGDARTLYGYNLGNPQSILPTRNGIVNNNPSTRWYDMGHNLPADNYSEGEITKTIANKGWLNNFIHYHSATVDYLDHYFGLVDNTVDTNFVWRSGYGEAVEYMWQRDLVRKVIARDINDTVLVLLALDGEVCEDTINGVDTKMIFNRITTPISLKIDLSGTSLSGHSIKSRYGKLLNLGDNKYILDWQLNKGGSDEKIYSNILYVHDTPSYINLSRPQITSSTVGSSTITVTTDIPTKAVLFRGNVGSPEYQVTTFKRSNTLNTTHVFDISGNYTWWVGVITEYNQSSLLKLN